MWILVLRGIGGAFLIDWWGDVGGIFVADARIGWQDLSSDPNGVNAICVGAEE